MPYGEMRDMIACYQIIHGAKPAENPGDLDDEDIIPDID